MEYYYDNWNDGYLIEGGALGQNSLGNLIRSFPEEMDKDVSDLSNLSNISNPHHEYRYREILNNAFNRYHSLKQNDIKKDAAMTFTAIAAIGITIMCIESILMKIVVLAIGVILSFEIELQIPAASIILSLFVFKDSSSFGKGLLIILSLISLIYFYCSNILIVYSYIIWWINIIIVLLWIWLLFTVSGSVSGTYNVPRFYGGDSNLNEDILNEYEAYDDEPIPEDD